VYTGACQFTVQAKVGGFRYPRSIPDSIDQYADNIGKKLLFLLTNDEVLIEI